MKDTIEIALQKRVIYAGEVHEKLLEFGMELPIANKLIYSCETATTEQTQIIDKLEHEIGIWRSQCKENDRELCRLRAQLDMVHLIFGGNRNV